MTIDDIVKIISRTIAPLKRKVLLSIAHGIIEASKDDGPLQFIQATYMADETKNDVRKMHHFGFSSHAPKGSECIAVSVAGNREASVIIATENREFRFKNLGEGEVAVYSKDGDFIHFKNGKAIEISTNALTINAVNTVTVNTATANVNASAGANITSPMTTVDGDMTVTGDITAQKNINVTQNVTVTGNVQGTGVIGTATVGAPAITAATSLIVAGTELKDYQTHTHNYNDVGAPSNPNVTGGVN